MSSPTCSPSCANQVLTELVSAVSSVIGPKLCVEVVLERLALDVERPGRVDRRARRDRAAVESGRGGHHLEGRAGRVLALGGAVEQRRRSSVVVESRESQVVRNAIRVVGRVGGHHPHPAGLRLDRDHGAEPGGLEVVQRHPLRGRVEVGDDVVALLIAAAQLVEDRAELRAVADQLVVVGLLELAVALADEAVADRVPVERPLRIAAHVAQVGAVALRDRAGDHRAVGGEDAAARDLLLLQQRPLVGRLFLQRLRVEHRPVGREADQHREEDDDQAEQLDDLAVHDPSSAATPRGAVASRRARSEISSSRASSTKLATIELPP